MFYVRLYDTAEQTFFDYSYTSLVDALRVCKDTVIFTERQIQKLLIVSSVHLRMTWNALEVARQIKIEAV